MRGAAALAALLAAAAGCGGPQHALEPRGPAAERIADIWWVMFALGAAVSVVVIALLLIALGRSRRRAGGASTREVDGRWLVWSGGVAIPVVILFGILVYSVRVGTAVYPPRGGGDDALTIEVVGHQFWWEVRYPEQGITTANEIRMPAGRPVRFLVSSPDVIHSFWVPQLQGKIDMIPGRLHTIWMTADRPGLFRGQCAEYCGMAHALMAFWVEAMPEERFAAWVEARTAALPEPADPEVARGREVFFAAGCGDCHSTRGAPLPPALGQAAPDLSDLATRRTLAAGTLPNSAESLREWIADPAATKPGVRMPATRLPAGEMRALLAYLQSLR